MKTFFQATMVLLSLIAAACGQAQQPSSTLSDELSQSFTAAYSNNSNSDFDLVTGNDALKITQSYIHIPANNLFGNRYLVVDFSVNNRAYDKKVEVAFDGNWRTTAFKNFPANGPDNGSAYVRFLGSDNGVDRFSLVLHNVIFNPYPTIELKVRQDAASSGESYSKIRLRQKDRTYQQKITFVTQTPKDEVRVNQIRATTESGKTYLKIDLDLKDIDHRKLLQIECPGCIGSDAYKKTLQFMSTNQIRTSNGVVFNSEANGREQVTLFVQYPLTSTAAIKNLTITYVAPGYIGTPTHGAYDGVYGTPYVVDVAISN